MISPICNGLRAKFQRDIETFIFMVFVASQSVQWPTKRSWIFKVSRIICWNLPNVDLTPAKWYGRPFVSKLWPDIRAVFSHVYLQSFLLHDIRAFFCHVYLRSFLLCGVFIPKYIMNILLQTRIYMRTKKAHIYALQASKSCLWFCFGFCDFVLGFCDSVLGFVILFWVLWFCFGFCDSVLSFVILFWVLWFCFKFCDSILGFVIVFWVLWFCFRVLWLCFGFYDFVLGFCDSVLFLRPP